MPVDIVTTRYLRACLGDILDRVKYGKERIIITKSGKTVGALIPMEDLAELERLELLTPLGGPDETG